MLALDPVVMVVDKGGAYKTFCEVYGGQYVHLDPEAGISINPFDLLRPEDVHGNWSNAAVTYT
jgi:type IV secretory pathway VirB4 component